jgi:CubicO group peptidase (beta-lactamase class C family)
MWGQQKGEVLLPESEMVRMTCCLDAVKPFREAFVYSQWNYGLGTEIVENATGTNSRHIYQSKNPRSIGNAANNAWMSE